MVMIFYIFLRQNLLKGDNLRAGDGKGRLPLGKRQGKKRAQLFFTKRWKAVKNAA